MKYQVLFSLKNNEKYSRLSSAAVVIGALGLKPVYDKAIQSQQWDIVQLLITLNCLNIGTPKTINFPFVPNGKLMNFRCLNI